MKRRMLLIVGALLMTALALYCIELASPQDDYFVERAGQLRDQRVLAAAVTTSRSETLQLVSSTGLEVHMRVRRPVDVRGRIPALILVGGHETGKDAVDLVGVPTGLAVAAIDYPHAGNLQVDGLVGTLRAIPGIQQTFIDTPPALLLVLAWLVQQPWVDPDRVELVGVSLGVPFAAAAGGVEQGFTRVWLIHGGADNVSWVTHAGRKAIRNETLRAAAARTALFLVYGGSFEARDWIPRIAPRPVVVIAARDDDYVPPEAQAPFLELAKSEHVELIWTEGLHVGPARTAELEQLLDIVLDRILPGG